MPLGRQGGQLTLPGEPLRVGLRPTGPVLLGLALLPVPAGCVVSASRSSASRARSGSPTRAAASTSSGSAHMETQGSKVFAVARRAADVAAS